MRYWLITLLLSLSLICQGQIFAPDKKLHIGGGAAIGGPLGAILLPAIGEAGRFGATAATKAAAQRAAELARSGGK